MALGLNVEDWHVSSPAWDEDWCPMDMVLLSRCNIFATDTPWSGEYCNHFFVAAIVKDG
jgi:hypothetical protein